MHLNIYPIHPPDVAIHRCEKCASKPCGPRVEGNSISVWLASLGVVPGDRAAVGELEAWRPTVAPKRPFLSLLFTGPIQ